MKKPVCSGCGDSFSGLSELKNGFCIGCDRTVFPKVYPVTSVRELMGCASPDYLQLCRARDAGLCTLNVDPGPAQGSYYVTYAISSIEAHRLVKAAIRRADQEERGESAEFFATMATTQYGAKSSSHVLGAETAYQGHYPGRADDLIR